MRGGLPIALDKVVLGCLAKKPEDRLSLVDLARVLVQFAPERARPALQRIEAVAGAPPALSRPDKQEKQPEPLPVLPLATERARTRSSWEDEKRKRGGGGLLVLLLLAGGGIFAAGLLTKSNLRILRGEVAHATSAIAKDLPAASQIPSALNQIPSALGINPDPTPAVDAGPAEESESNNESPGAIASANPTHTPAPLHSSTKHPQTVSRPHSGHWHKHH